MRSGVPRGGALQRESVSLREPRSGVSLRGGEDDPRLVRRTDRMPRCVRCAELRSEGRDRRRSLLRRASRCLHEGRDEHARLRESRVQSRRAMPRPAGLSQRARRLPLRFAWRRTGGRLQERRRYLLLRWSKRAPLRGAAPRDGRALPWARGLSRGPRLEDPLRPGDRSRGGRMSERGGGRVLDGRSDDAPLFEWLLRRARPLSRPAPLPRERERRHVRSHLGSGRRRV